MLARAGCDRAEIFCQAANHAGWLIGLIPQYFRSPVELPKIYVQLPKLKK
jgi:hypothetical protein